MVVPCRPGTVTQAEGAALANLAGRLELAVRSPLQFRERVPFLAKLLETLRVGPCDQFEDFRRVRLSG